MLGIKMHDMLNNIVNNAFPNNTFSKFFIKMIPKEYATIHGRYFLQTRVIEIYNLSRDSKRILITTIHELAHHVEMNLKGKTGHSRTFYEIHKKLLTTAVGMGIISLSDIDAITDSADAIQLRTYFGDIKLWNIDKIEFKRDYVVVKIKFGFEIKDVLKSRGYSYSAEEKLWEKEFEESEAIKETAFLKTIISEKNIIVKKASDITMETIYKMTIETKDNNFETLKLLKYKQESKYWVKNIASTTLNIELDKLKKSGVKNAKVRVSGKLVASF